MVVEMHTTSVISLNIVTNSGRGKPSKEEASDVSEPDCNPAE